MKRQVSSDIQSSGEVKRQKHEPNVNIISNEHCEILKEDVYPFYLGRAPPDDILVLTAAKFNTSLDAINCWWLTHWRALGRPVAAEPVPAETDTMVKDYIKGLYSQSAPPQSQSSSASPPHSSPPESAVSENKLQCEKCKATFTCIDHLKRHGRFPCTRFYCTKCHVSYDTQYKLSVHFNAKHLNLPRVPCEQCGATFSTVGVRNHHLRVSCKKPPLPLQPSQPVESLSLPIPLPLQPVESIPHPLQPLPLQPIEPIPLQHPVEPVNDLLKDFPIESQVLMNTLATREFGFETSITLAKCAFCKPIHPVNTVKLNNMQCCIPCKKIMLSLYISKH